MSKAATKIMDDVTTELPEGWRMATIGELLKVRNGYAFSNKDYTESGALLVRQSNLGGDTVSMRKAKYLPARYLAEHPEYQVHKGDILIGMSGSIGKLCTYDLDEPALQNQRTGLLVFQDEDQKRWVWYYLPLLEQGLKEISKGVAVQNVSAKQIESFSIPVAPPEDQRRIVAEIEKQFSRLDEAVASLKRVKANLKRYKAAVLKAAVEGKLTEEWRKQNPDVEPASKLLERILAERRTKWEEAELAKMKAKGKAPKDDKWKEKYKEPAAPALAEDAGSIPDSWVWASIDQLCFVVRGASPRPAGDPKYFGGETPWITVGELTKDENMYLDSVESFVTEAGKEASRYLEPGTFLLTNSGATLGVPKITRIGGCINDGSVALLDLPLSLEKYLYYVLAGMTQKLRLINQGAAQPNLNTTIVKNIPVAIPPLVELPIVLDQLEVHLSSSSSVLKSERMTDLRLSRIRQSILSSAFAGERVLGPDAI